MRLVVATGLLALGVCSCLSATPGVEDQVSDLATDDVADGSDPSTEDSVTDDSVDAPLDVAVTDDDPVADSAADPIEAVEADEPAADLPIESLETSEDVGSSDVDTDACSPDCAGKQCGANGCGGSCGTCPSGQACDPLFKCENCTPDCWDKDCGEDGCGGSCGACNPGTTKCDAGKCIACTVECVNKICGDDSCGGVCGVCPNDEYTCTPQGQCCHLKCSQEIVCGLDGCGGSCGTCESLETCSTGKCDSTCWTEQCPLGCGPLTDCHCKVPPTGMATCAIASGEVECSTIKPGAPYFGQDGHFPSGPLDFSDGLDGEGTVTDQNTGLVWSKASYGPMKWQDGATYPAKEQCEQNKAGLPGAGWRLPNPWELMGLVDFSKACPMWHPAFGTTCPVYAKFWSTEYALPSSSSAFYVDFDKAGVGLHSTNVENMSVRCVRGGSESKSKINLIDEGDTVYAQALDLRWERKPSPSSFSWEAALNHCLAKGSGWRLPNVKELVSLIDYHPSQPPCNSGEPVVDPVFDMTCSDVLYYWSSTPWHYQYLGKVFPLTVYFARGDVYYTAHPNVRALCVRTGL